MPDTSRVPGAIEKACAPDFFSKAVMNFTYLMNQKKKRLTDIAWSIAWLNLEVKDNQVASIMYPPSQSMLSWSAANAIWTEENVSGSK